MKNSSSILVVIVASIFLLTSCSLDSDCTSNKLGTIQLSSRANNFLVLEDEAEVTFLNQEGKVITFENTVIENLGGKCDRPIWQSRYCDRGITGDWSIYC